MTRRVHYAAVATAAVLPRLAVLLYERDAITRANVDKGDTFARTFLDSGTYGFIPAHPSAYTQPLYGFFLVPVYWIAGRSWVTVGLAHLLVAVATAVLVYEIGRRVAGPAAGLVAAVAATLHPYLIWHDMHMNREILDGALAAGLVLLTLLAAERRSWWWACALGAVTGVAVLGNVRLDLLPLLLAAYLIWRRGRIATTPAILVVAAAAAVVAPWVVRNDISVGCTTVTTDARALWKANNPQTLEILRSGRWIDNVRPIPGAPITPQDAGELYRRQHRIVETDECAQMRFYRTRALRFMRDHPGEKAKLTAWAARMLWQPSVTKTSDRRGAGTWLDTARSVAEPLFAVPLFVLGLVGLMLVPRRFAVLAVALLAYQTLFAMLFVGETRYRVPWDFLLAVPASVAVLRLAELLRRRGRLALE